MAMTTTDARDQAIRDLTRHCGDGRLTLDELEDRIEEVYAAETDAEIAHALRDLPRTVAPAPKVDAPQPVVARPHVSHAPARSRERSNQLERTLKTVWCVSGFVALFNGLFWLALILWFVLPKLVLPNLRRI
jgi:hypothetical protein